MRDESTVDSRLLDAIAGKPAGRRAGRGELLNFIREIVIPHRGDECILWPYHRDKFGYARIGRDGLDMLASRLVCEMINGAPPSSKYEAAHSCGNGHRGCVSARHLSWKTSAGNKADQVAHGTTKRGERNHFSRLTREQVAAIRRACAANESRRVLSRSFGVSETTISAIHRRDSWSWLAEDTAS